MCRLHAGSVALLKASSVVREGEGGKQEALRVDAMQAEHLETRTLTGVKRGRVIYLAGGRGNTGSIFLLMKN